MNALHSDAIALFGSICRNTADHLSDRDILIVHDSRDVVGRDAALLMQRGWSVAKYSWKRLERLSRRQALFVQHLKLESLILRDQQHRLSELLARYQPAADYDHDVSQATKIISLVERVPDSIEGLGWAFDVLAVGIRILGIGYLANEGRYAFGFREILSELVEVNRLSKSDAAVLSGLRNVKAAYRQRRWRNIPTQRELFEVMSAVRRLGVDVDCHIQGYSQIHGNVSYEGEITGYAALRAAERRYWMLGIPNRSDTEEFVDVRTRVARAIFRPQDYLGVVKSRGAYLCQSISKLEGISL